MARYGELMLLYGDLMVMIESFNDGLVVMNVGKTIINYPGGVFIPPISGDLEDGL